MANSNKINISDELLAAYLEGNTTPEETMLVLHALENDELLKEILITSERLDSILAESTPEYDLLPMQEMAAKSEGNLCDVQCEEFILRKLNVVYNNKKLSAEAKENKWLKDKGTPLHSVGRLLEQNDLSVSRRYNAVIFNLYDALNNNEHVILIVNPYKLNKAEINQQLNEKVSYHAIVVIKVNETRGSVTVYDPSIQNSIIEYPLGQLLNAWNDSQNFMVSAKQKNPDSVYIPRPIDLSDVDLSEELLELREAIAENAHDVWAAARINEGWSYGKERDDNKKENPDLVPYGDLPDSEKQYDREMALNTIKLVRKLGYDFIKTSNTEHHKSLIRKLRLQVEVRNCNECGSPIFKDQVYCDQCGRKLKYKDFLT